MILGTAEVTPTKINVKLYNKYSKLNKAQQQSGANHKKDYIEVNNRKNTNNYEIFLKELTVPKDPNKAISKLNQLRNSTSANINNSNKNIIMGMNLMKIKLQLQENQTNQN